MHHWLRCPKLKTTIWQSSRNETYCETRFVSMSWSCRNSIPRKLVVCGDRWNQRFSPTTHRKNEKKEKLPRQEQEVPLFLSLFFFVWLVVSSNWCMICITHACQLPNKTLVWHIVTSWGVVVTRIHSKQFVVLQSAIKPYILWNNGDTIYDEMGYGRFARWPRRSRS